MVDPTYQQQLVTDFGGSWLSVDAPDVPSGKGFVSENIEYAPGKAQTRLGFGVAYNTNLAMSAMFNWVSSLGDLLVYYATADNSVRLFDIASPTPQTVIPGDLVGAAAIFTDAGARLYCAFFTSMGIGASGCKVISYQSAAFVSDPAFQPPLTYTPSAPTEPGPGTITGGTHYVAYRVEYRSGFITRPSPDSGNGVPGPATFEPVEFVASGGANAAWTLNTTWPDGAINVYMLMTTVVNPAQFFLIPGAVEPVVGGVASSITFTIDISDDLLFASGTDQTDSIFFLTNTVLGVPPFFPSQVFTHGNRMCYVTTVSDSNDNQSGAIYVSNRSAYQEISPDLSLIQLPGFKNIICAISLDNVMYIFGPQWTYRTIDNGADPVTWPTPGLVDGRRGTQAVRGAVVSPAGTYAWVAVPGDGLYFFQGVYPSLPISYYQSPDWERINWDAQGSLDIKDNPAKKSVYVLAALDEAETPSHLLKWDYTNGFGPEQVQYSIDSIQNYDLGCIEVVENQLADMPLGVPHTPEFWLGPSSPAPILRNKSPLDDDPYIDNGFPIFANYETSLFPKQGTPGEIYQHHGANIRAKGEGDLFVTAYTLDHAQSFPLLKIVLALLPGKILWRAYDLISEGVSLLFTQGENLISDGGFEG